MEWKLYKVGMSVEELLAQVVALSAYKGGVSSDYSLCCKHKKEIGFMMEL